MYQRGDQVEVQGRGGRRAILWVWEDHGRGVTLSSETGYMRALAGDLDAPLVGFPRRDIQRLVKSAPEGVGSEPD